ncbi:hypothetical protein [Taklimakanibacter lacteus]|uniref:hypothetical protein n=1 Tax=Taklimakanibacter lacteus TaxID=2268456 RepID=UPI0013C412AE
MPEVARTKPPILNGWYYTPLALPQLGHFQSSSCISARRVEELLARKEPSES